MTTTRDQDLRTGVWYCHGATVFTLKEEPGRYHNGQPLLVNDHSFLVQGPNAEAVAAQIHSALTAPPRPVDAERVAKPSWIDRAAWVAGQIIDMMPRDPELQPSRGQDGLALPHLLFMADELHGKRVDGDTKACRWLGWLQAGIVNAGLADLEAMKELNLASKEVASPAQATDKAAEREGVDREARAEIVAASYYNQMMELPEPWPHGKGWAGKTESFKAKVRERIANALDLLAPQPNGTEASRGVIPAGWKLVPVEPTEAMCEAGEQAAFSAYTGTPVLTPGDAWAAMIAATPTPPRSPDSTGPAGEDLPQSVYEALLFVYRGMDKIEEVAAFAREHAAYIIRSSAALTPSAPIAAPVRDDVERERVLQRIAVFAGMIPEKGESWRSWYSAAFDMLAAEIASLSAPAGDVPGEAQTGPRTTTTSRQTCQGCPALELKDWSFMGENDDLDTGTSAKCSASAGKSITAYWSVLSTTPEWCPVLARSPGEAQTQEGGR